jgi:hypothetical protein
MEFWIHVSQFGKNKGYYWLRVKDAGEESIVKVDDYTLSAAYLERFLEFGGVSLNRSIYVVGQAEEAIGFDSWTKNFSKQIFRLDTDNLDRGWKKLEVELTQERFDPQIAQFDGKVYIFESAKALPAKIQPLEVYDPVKKTINLLPQTVQSSDYVLLGVDHDCKRFVFRARLYSRLVFYYPYNEDENKWEIKGIPRDLFEIMFGGLRLVYAIAHKTLYCVDRKHRLRAYNLEYNMISVPLSLSFIPNYTSVMSSVYDEEFGTADSIANFYHVNGERFCLFWYRGGFNYNILYCSFLSISNVFIDGAFLLRASELVTHTYKIPKGGLIRTITLIN